MNGPRSRQRRTRRRGTGSAPPVSLGVAGLAFAPPGPSNQSELEQFAPQIPRLSPAALQAVLAESERPIREWLDANESYVRTLSFAAATAEAMRRVPKAAGQGAGNVAGTIRNWAAERGITMRSRSLLPHAADAAAASAGGGGGDNGLIAAVRGAMKVVTEGIDVERGPGFARLKVSGATLGLREQGDEISGTVTPTGGFRFRAGDRQGGVKVSESGLSVSARPPGPGIRFKAGVKWSGALNLSSSVGNFHFNMSVSPERWSMSLTFPSNEMPADLSRFGSLFGQGEMALRAALRETANVGELGEIPDLPDRLSPHIGPIKKTVETLSRAARTKPGVSFGLRLEGPGARPGQPGAEAGGSPAPRAATMQGVLNITF